MNFRKVHNKAFHQCLPRFLQGYPQGWLPRQPCPVGNLPFEGSGAILLNSEALWLFQQPKSPNRGLGPSTTWRNSATPLRMTNRGET